MPRRTSRYALDTFLRQLARTGNFALAADLAGLAKSGLYKRRARDGEFAEACKTALEAFSSSPERGGGPPKAVEGPSHLRRRQCAGGMPAEGGGASEQAMPGAWQRREAKAVEGPNPRSRSWEGKGEGQPFLTAHGDLVLTRGQSRPAQIRRSPAGRLTQAGIDAFLGKLAQTANIRLAAGSVGVAASSIYRRRQADPAFAKAMREALMTGYDRVEAALLESAHRALDPDPDYEAELEQIGGAPMEPMTFDQAFMLLTLHRRQARDGWHGFRRQRPGVASDEEVERALKRGLRRFGVKC